MADLTPRSLDSFQSRKSLTVDGKSYEYFSLPDAEKNGLPGISALPYSLKVLLENLLRFEDGQTVTADDIRAMAQWLVEKQSTREIAFRPARVLMQDFTGVPAVVDLAAMRDAMKRLAGDPRRSIRLCQWTSSSTIPFRLTDSAPRAPSPSTSNSNIERNRERYNSCAGVRRPSIISASCPRNRHRAIRSIWNISPKSSMTKDQDGTASHIPDTLVGTD